jgi:pilus assembly protein FimV
MAVDHDKELDLEDLDIDLEDAGAGQSGGSALAEDDLEQYGVWVKVEPRTVDEGTPSRAEETRLESLDVDASAQDDGLTEEEERLLGKLEESTPEAPALEDLGDLPVPEEHDAGLLQADTEQVELSLSDDAASPDRFDDIETLDQDLGMRPQHGPDAVAAARADVLQKIEVELAAIRGELAALKNELVHLRQPSAEPAPRPSETEREAGFFSDDSDETIALTGDELDNILNTAEITEEEASDTPAVDELGEVTMLGLDDAAGTADEGLVLGPEMETLSLDEPLERTDDLETITLDEPLDEPAEMETISLDEPLAEQSPLEALSLDETAEPGDLEEMTLEDPTAQADELEAITFDEPEAAAAELEVMELEEPGAEMEAISLDEPASESELEIPVFDETEIPALDNGEIALEVPEAAAETEEALDLALPDVEEIGLDALEEAEPATGEPAESLDELEIELSEDEQAAPARGALSEAADEIALPEPEEELVLEMPEEPAAFDEAIELQAEEPPAEMDEAIALDIPELETPADDLAMHGDGLTLEIPADEIAAAASGIPGETDDDAGLEEMEALEEAPLVEEEPPARVATAPAQATPSGQPSPLPAALRDEIRTVLKYMDQLLEALPDAKIKEFAESEYFEVYKRLFEELEIAG